MRYFKLSLKYWQPCNYENTNVIDQSMYLSPLSNTPLLLKENPVVVHVIISTLDFYGAPSDRRTRDTISAPPGRCRHHLCNRTFDLLRAEHPNTIISEPLYRLRANMRTAHMLYSLNSLRARPRGAHGLHQQYVLDVSEVVGRAPRSLCQSVYHIPRLSTRFIWRLEIKFTGSLMLSRKTTRRPKPSSSFFFFFSVDVLN